MFVLSPIAVPIAKLLDKVLHDDGGHGSHGADAEEDVTEGNYYNRTEVGTYLVDTICFGLAHIISSLLTLSRITIH